MFRLMKGRRHLGQVHSDGGLEDRLAIEMGLRYAVSWAASDSGPEIRSPDSGTKIFFSDHTQQDEPRGFVTLQTINST